MTARAALLLLLLSATALCREAEDKPKMKPCIREAARALLPAFRRITQNAVKSPMGKVHNKLTSIVERLAVLTKHLYKITQWQDNFEARLDEFESLLKSARKPVKTSHSTPKPVLRSTEAPQKPVKTSQSTPKPVPRTTEAPQKPVKDCSDLPRDAPSGVYQVKLRDNREPVRAFCEQDKDKGAWTVIQRRADIKPRQDFFLGWKAYKQGFGKLDKEFWWGLEHLFLLTSQPDRTYELLVDMEDFDGKKRYARYKGFRILSEAKLYRLKLGKYSGNSKDSLGFHNNQPFSTKDADHDSYSKSCAKLFKGGWWYKNCHRANLNGVYLSGAHKSVADGVNWSAWRGFRYSLKNIEMKIRPM